MRLSLNSNLLSNLGDIAHGFFGRRGGVSSGIYASLNCGPGSDDDKAAVSENRQRVQTELGAEELVTLSQIHSAEAITLNETPTDKIEADALVTRQPYIALGVLTADCGPVLFADPEARVIGAAHAGWKGAVGGILENTLAAMEALGAKRSRIIAALGPTIAQESYQVDALFYENLCAQENRNQRFFAPSDPARFDAFAMNAAQSISHYLFDLPAYIAARLEAAGISQIDDVATDTYTGADDYFSYRRSTHKGERDYGRQISAIMLKG